MVGVFLDACAGCCKVCPRARTRICVCVCVRGGFYTRHSFNTPTSSIFVNLARILRTTHLLNRDPLITEMENHLRLRSENVLSLKRSLNGCELAHFVQAIRSAVHVCTVRNPPCTRSLSILAFLYFICVHVRS